MRIASLAFALLLSLGCSAPSSGGPTPSTQPVTASGPGVGEPCPAGACAPGLTCVRYYGIAGPRGGEFTSCEVPCPGGTACPSGQKCITIADGPGQVCRP